MASKKDLFTIFQDNQHLFDQAPSGGAWDKLEGRLDRHRRRNRFSMIRSLSMAAAVLLLAVVAILLSIAVGEKPSKLLNKSPQPIASESLEKNTLESVEELRQTRYTQLAERQRQRSINEGSPDRKLVLARNREASSALETVSSFSWLEGNWEPRAVDAHAPINWKKIGEHALEGTINNGGKEELIRIFQEENTLYFATDFGQGQQLRYALQYATPYTADFERKGGEHPRQIELTRNKNNSLSIVYRQQTSEKPLHLLAREQQVFEWRKLQLQ